MQVEDILAPMRAELSAARAALRRLKDLGSVEAARLMCRRDDLITTLRVNEQFVRAALRNKEKAHA
jgi:hypothetical protein